MREVNAMPGLEIHLGRVGENMAVCVVLDVTDWRQTYGDGSVQLLHKRNGDQYPYPCAIEVDGGRVCWPVTASDVAVAGKGWAELQYLVGEVCVKSETFATRVERALGNAGPTPPEPHEGWVQQVLEAGAQVEASAEEAADAAARAQEHAESVAELMEVAVQAHEAAVEALEALEGIDEAQQAVAADRAAIEAMTVTSETLEPGEDATVEKRKQDGVMTLHFGIPTGDSGVYVGTTKPTDPNVRVWINPNGEANDNPGGGGGSGADGEDGGYYTPAVNNGVLSWEASKDDMPAVGSANIMGPAGPQGEQGPAGPAGADGAQGPAGDPGVYVGTEEPTDPSVKVWINPEGDAVEIPSGGGGGEWTVLSDTTLTEEVQAVYEELDENAGYTELFAQVMIVGSATNSGGKAVRAGFNEKNVAPSNNTVYLSGYALNNTSKRYITIFKEMSGLCRQFALYGQNENPNSFSFIHGCNFGTGSIPVRLQVYVDDGVLGVGTRIKLWAR